VSDAGSLPGSSRAFLVLAPSEIARLTTLKIDLAELGTRLSLRPKDLANALGMLRADSMRAQPYALPTLIKASAATPDRAWNTPHCGGMGGADGSILNGEAVKRASEQATGGVPNTAFVKEVPSSTRHKFAASNCTFWALALPNGDLLRPLHREVPVKQSLASWPLPVQQPHQSLNPTSHGNSSTRRMVPITAHGA